ncbi:MAG: hypothetical protein DRH97_01720 [Chloroflexi bacterium]|nr:MAG: hypothetical protein DRH97_01720 [Chloroflexota bacterium]
MNENLELLQADPFFAVYDGDGDDDSNTDDSNIDDSNTDDSNTGDKTFTQDDVNRIMAKEKAETKRATQKRITELEGFRSSSKLSDAELKNLNGQIDTMQKEIETKEEQSRRERETTAKKHTREMSSITDERDGWKHKYTDSIVQRSLTDAALSNNAFNPDQVVAILRPNTEVVAELDKDGKETGRYKAQVTFNTRDDKDEAVTIVDDPTKIVKRMLDEERYMNLFKSDKTSGLNLKTTTTRKNKGVPTDTTAYIKQRNEGRKNRTRH